MGAALPAPVGREGESRLTPCRARRLGFNAWAGAAARFPAGRSGLGQEASDRFNPSVAVLFQHGKGGRLWQADELARGRAPELAVHLLGHGRRRVAIPLADDDERRGPDSGRIPRGLALRRCATLMGWSLAFSLAAASTTQDPRLQIGHSVMGAGAPFCRRTFEPLILEPAPQTCSDGRGDRFQVEAGRGSVSQGVSTCSPMALGTKSYARRCRFSRFAWTWLLPPGRPRVPRDRRLRGLPAHPRRVCARRPARARSARGLATDRFRCHDTAPGLGGSCRATRHHRMAAREWPLVGRALLVMRRARHAESSEAHAPTQRTVLVETTVFRSADRVGSSGEYEALRQCTGNVGRPAGPCALACTVS
jgi:hypothetical protein